MRFQQRIFMVSTVIILLCIGCGRNDQVKGSSNGESGSLCGVTLGEADTEIKAIDEYSFLVRLNLRFSHCENGCRGYVDYSVLYKEDNALDVNGRKYLDDSFDWDNKQGFPNISVDRRVSVPRNCNPGGLGGGVGRGSCDYKEVIFRNMSCSKREKSPE